MEPRVSLITLGVGDLTRSRVFYEQLGFRASSIGGGEVVFFQAGALALCLFPRESLASDAKVSVDGSGFRGIALAHNVREKTDVEAVIAQANAAGAEVVKPAEDAPWGGRSAPTPTDTSGKSPGTRIFRSAPTGRCRFQPKERV